MDSGELKSGLNDLKLRLDEIREGVFDVSSKENRLKQIEEDLTKEEVWSDLELSQKISKEKTVLEKSLASFKSAEEKVSDGLMFIDIAEEEGDEASIKEIIESFYELEKLVSELEFSKMFTNKMDPASAYIEIQSGSGGTEAQDWAEMLLRMYSKWSESRGFEVDLTEISHGEVAGIKSATLHVSGEYSYGWLRTETGIHRLVRKSPFDSGSRRHTSFAGVNVYPEIDESVDIEINPADLRIDTYRASGAGGQHINKTDSAVRITHEPSGVVVQCQNDRSQHRNKAQAMDMLKAQLYLIDLEKRNEEKQAMEDAKSDIGWGHQIRSYVLDQSRIKDLRTGVEVGNTQGVLDGNLDPFITESLKQGV